MIIRWIIVDIALLYWIIRFYKKNKYDYYEIELSMLIFFFVVVTFLLWLSFVDFSL